MRKISLTVNEKRLRKLVNLRDQIIFRQNYNPEDYDWRGLKYFERLRRNKFTQLLDEGLVSLYPWTFKTIEFYWFLETYGMDERCYLMGTTDSFDRLYSFRKRCEVCDRSELNYFGVELTGIRRDEKFEDKKAEKVFKFLFSDANEFSLNPPYACYDE
ncbi:MAG: hypothetical protein IJQ24_01970 [Synergistaceae bacterium]|nr:hypothetical protein [Synergistaceae bacterium]